MEKAADTLRGGVDHSEFRGYVFAIGDSSECFSFVRDWVEKEDPGLMRARERSGFGWKRWSRQCLYGQLGLYDDYRLRRPWALPKVRPTESVS